MRSLRTQEKTIKARIDEISPLAADEAVAILAEQGLDRGEFEVEGVGSFQLQRTDVFNLADYNKYKGEEAVNWRLEAKKKIKAQNTAKACTASMAGYVKTFVELNHDKEPDEIKLTVKVIDKKETEKSFRCRQLDDVIQRRNKQGHSDECPCLEYR